jgi:hypothetical protein
MHPRTRLSAGARLAASLISVMSLCTISLPAAANDAPVQLTPAQSGYLESCGGCHGIQGTASKKDVPQLRSEVGRFLCTAAGREYIVRLPNVAFADMSDRLLADVMNFVVFDLGGASAPRGAAAYSVAEVAGLRRRPLKNAPLARMRANILADARLRCGR